LVDLPQISQTQSRPYSPRQDYGVPTGCFLLRSEAKPTFTSMNRMRSVDSATIPTATGCSIKRWLYPNLPDASSPELRGAYGHELKNLTIGPDRHLYVDIASSTNADPKDTTSDPIRCAIYRYDLNGGNRTLFAKGIRNAEGLAFVSGTNALWAVVNGTDNIRFPFHRSWKGSGLDDYGKRITSYIDDHPPDTFIHVKLGADYGWPFAEPDPDSPSGLDDMPLDPSYETNRDWRKYPESRFTRSDKGMRRLMSIWIELKKPLGLSISWRFWPSLVFWFRSNGQKPVCRSLR
jgi:hypothetical protein